MKQMLFLTLIALATFLLSSCSSTVYEPIDQTPGATYEKGVPGGTVVETHELTATVTHIDASARKVTLATKDGHETTVTCGPAVINFDQIHVGDVVKTTMTDELTVAMADATRAPTVGGAAMVALSPKGAKPAAVMAATQQYTATITNIDLKRRHVTLAFPDGTSRTFAVRKDIDLSQRKVGEAVAFRVAVAVAISMHKE